LLPYAEMDPILGKRKRRADLEASTSPAPVDTASTKHLQALFRKHFEAKYKPLPTLSLAQPSTGEDDSISSESEQSDWEGIDADNSSNIPVIEHIDRPATTDDVPRSELKKFMVHRL
jgi:hypothetical protein